MKKCSGKILINPSSSNSLALSSSISNTKTLKVHMQVMQTDVKTYASDLSGFRWRNFLASFTLCYAHEITLKQVTNISQVFGRGLEVYGANKKIIFKFNLKLIIIFKEIFYLTKQVKTCFKIKPGSKV